MNIAKIIRKSVRILAKHKKPLTALFGVLCVILFYFYMQSFLQVGVDFDGVFLKKTSDGASVVYEGENEFGYLAVEVSRGESSSVVSYTVPLNKKHPFKAEFEPYSEFWQKVTVTDMWTDKVLFEGRFQRGNNFLYNEYNAPVYGAVDQTVSGENPYINFSPNLRKLCGFAAGEYERIAGNWFCLIPAILLILAVFVHVRWPMITMRIEHAVLGREPLPSEARIFLHALVHIVLLITAGVLLSAGV